MDSATSEYVPEAKPVFYVRSPFGATSLLGALPVLVGVFLLSINVWLVAALGSFVTQNPVSLLLITASGLLGLFMLIYAFALLRYEKAQADGDRRKYQHQYEEYLKAVIRYNEHIVAIRNLMIKSQQR